MNSIKNYMMNVEDAQDKIHHKIRNWFWWSWNANSGDTGGIVRYPPPPPPFFFIPKPLRTHGQMRNLARQLVSAHLSGFSSLLQHPKPNSQPLIGTHQTANSSTCSFSAVCKPGALIVTVLHLGSKQRIYKISISILFKFLRLFDVECGASNIAVMRWPPNG